MLNYAIQIAFAIIDFGISVAITVQGLVPYV